MKMNLANKLTIFRIILVPIMAIIPYLNLQGDFMGLPLTYFWMFLIFIVASITDKLDGYIARSRNQVTTFGKFLDPLADKILVLAVSAGMHVSTLLTALVKRHKAMKF